MTITLRHNQSSHKQGATHENSCVIYRLQFWSFLLVSKTSFYLQTKHQKKSQNCISLTLITLTHQCTAMPMCQCWKLGLLWSARSVLIGLNCRVFMKCIVNAIGNAPYTSHIKRFLFDQDLKWIYYCSKQCRSVSCQKYKIFWITTYNIPWPNL